MVYFVFVSRREGYWGQSGSLRELVPKTRRNANPSGRTTKISNVISCLDSLYGD
jgi:hypothetical protein